MAIGTFADGILAAGSTLALLVDLATGSDGGVGQADSLHLDLKILQFSTGKGRTVPRLPHRRWYKLRRPRGVPRGNYRLHRGRRLLWGIGPGSCRGRRGRRGSGTFRRRGPASRYSLDGRFIKGREGALTGFAGGAAELRAGDAPLAGIAVGAGALSDGTALWLSGDADEGHRVIGTASGHSATLELVVGRGELAEEAGRTVLGGGGTDLGGVGGGLPVGDLIVGASEGGDGLGRGDGGSTATLVALVGQGPLTTVAVGAGSIRGIEGVTRGDLVVLHEDVLVGRTSVWKEAIGWWRMEETNRK